MTRQLAIQRAGPAVSVQDLGRPGYLSLGLARGGAADLTALAEAAALLVTPIEDAVIEMVGSPLRCEIDSPARIALTGAEMRAQIDGDAVEWGGSHGLAPGAVVSLTPLGTGVSVLAIAGGIGSKPVMGSRSVNLTAGIGQRLIEGDTLSLGVDPGGPIDKTLSACERFDGGVVRVVPGPQTSFFGEDALDRLASLALTRSARANRQGVALDGAGDALLSEAGRRVVSDAVIPGDIQVTGDGQPYVLGPDCQTTGGYPRIGSVVPQDLAIVMQAPVGAPIRFVPVTLEEALADWLDPNALSRRMAKRIRPRLNSPSGADLLRHQLIGGVTKGE